MQRAKYVVLLFNGYEFNLIARRWHSKIEKIQDIVDEITLKKEIKKISQAIEVNGLTLVPLKGYFKDNKFKILLGVCRGKKTYDKRETIKNRDIEREVRKNLKNYR